LVLKGGQTKGLIRKKKTRGKKEDESEERRYALPLMRSPGNAAWVSLAG